MLPIVEIRTFGTLHVVRDGVAVTESDWHTRQARQLLKILITERPRPVSTDRLIEILWPTSTPGAAATTLRSAINALRNVVEPDRRNRAPSRYIITQAPGYAFSHHEDIWLDVDVFERELDQARRTVDIDTRRRLLDDVVLLYKDDYLISDPYADWVQNERERLRERYFNALLELSEIQATVGDFAEAISACRRILARDEVRENAYQLLMRYQAESGDSASALLSYERCRTILAEELGADPSPLTQQLHQRVLNGEIEPVAHTSMSHVSHLTSSSGVHNGSTPLSLPQQNPVSLPQSVLLPALDERFISFFVGREQEVAEIAGLVDSALAGHGDLLVLEGEAGVGKTRLAYTALQRAADGGATVISATCQTLEQKFPFSPLADSIGRYLHSLPDSVLRELPHASLTELAQIVPSLQDHIPDLPVLTSDHTLRTDESHQRLIDSIVGFLAYLAELRPLLIFLDDLHWADPDTLAVLSRLSQRLGELPLFMLLAYRSDDMVENQALLTLLHAFNRTHQQHIVEVTRLSLEQVQQLVQLFTGAPSEQVNELAHSLYEATHGNALFVTEALRALNERFQSIVEQPAHDHAIDGAGVWSAPNAQGFSLQGNQRVHEIILERVERLPSPAKKVLRLSAVIERDFSIDLLELASENDPLDALDVLLQRQFLVERSDERLDFSHEVVRQAVYSSMNTLQRRRYHCRIGDALVKLGRDRTNPAETAFHFGQAGGGKRHEFAQYSVLAGEKLLNAFGLRQSIEQFDHALAIIEHSENDDAQLARRALMGRGLAYESLLDPDGVTDTYRRLQNWARAQNDLELQLTVHSRLAFMLELVGQQRESNGLLSELIEAFQDSNVPRRSETINDLLERRRRIYSASSADEAEGWQPFLPAPEVPGDPVSNVLAILDPVHAVLPLMTYGWTLRVQGQLETAKRCLTKAAELALETNQRSLATIVYFQLAVIARMQGDLIESQAYNEESMALNRPGENSATELVSMWPRIASAFQSLHAGRIDEAERRLQRVLNFLDTSDSFRNHRNSAAIGLGMVALAHGDVEKASRILNEALADPINLYPYTHVQGLLGLARIAALQGDAETCQMQLQRALAFAGNRSLIEEYAEILLEIARHDLNGVPTAELLRDGYKHTVEAGMAPMAAQLLDAAEQVSLKPATAPGD